MLYIIISCWLLYLCAGCAWLMIYPVLVGQKLEGGFILFIFWPLHLFLVILAFILSWGGRKAWES